MKLLLTVLMLVLLLAVTATAAICEDLQDTFVVTYTEPTQTVMLQPLTTLASVELCWDYVGDNLPEACRTVPASSPSGGGVMQETVTQVWVEGTDLGGLTQLDVRAIATDASGQQAVPVVVSQVVPPPSTAPASVTQTNVNRTTGIIPVP